MHKWCRQLIFRWRQICLRSYSSFSDGKTVEAMLTNPGNHRFTEGDRMKIRYLPDRQEYPVLVEMLDTKNGV